MIDGILFDKDGTLFDFRASWGHWTHLFLRGNAGDDSQFAAMAGAIGFCPETDDFSPDSPVIAGTIQNVADRLLPFFPGETRSGLIQMINSAATRVRMVESVPLLPLFRRLRGRGLRLGVATNDSIGPARAHVAAHGLLPLLDYIVGADSGYGAKPDSGMCLEFAARFRLQPQRVLMVGDSCHDLDAGRAAGMRTVAVLTGIATRSDLAIHADVVLPDIGHLPALIDRLGPEMAMKTNKPE